METGEKGNISIWNIETQVCLGNILALQENLYSCLAFNKEGNKLLTLSIDNAFMLWSNNWDQEKEKWNLT